MTHKASPLPKQIRDSQVFLPILIIRELHLLFKDLINEANSCN